jgi:hypothetical protein
MSVQPHRWKRGDVAKRGAAPLLAASIAVVALFFGARRGRAQSDDRPTASASTLESVSPPASGDWERVDGAPADESDDSSDSQVLEIPQALDPNDAAAAQSQDGGDPSVADSGDGQSQADGSDSGSGADAPDQIGSINDYQSQPSETGPMTTYLPPMAARPLGMSPPIGLNPPMPMPPYSYFPPAGFGPNGMLPPGPVIVRPGVTGYMPPSSPMFMAPRPMAAMPGGWWNRVHR